MIQKLFFFLCNRQERLNVILFFFDHKQRRPDLNLISRGNQHFRKSRPFFLGLLLGYVLGVGGSFLVDVIWFPSHGHMIHHW